MRGIQKFLRIQVVGEPTSRCAWDLLDKFPMLSRFLESLQGNVICLRSDCTVETRGESLHIKFPNEKPLPGEDSLDDSGKPVIPIPVSMIYEYGFIFRPR